MSMLLNFRGNIIRHYVDIGHDVMLIYPAITHREELMSCIPETVRMVQVKVDPHGTGIIRDIFYLQTLCRIYKKERPDVVFHYTIKPNIYGSIAARIAKVPLKVAMVAGLGYIFEGRGFIKKIARILYKIGLRQVDRVIALNASNRNLLVEKGYVRSRNMLLFPCGEGVDLNKFSCDTDNFSHIRFLMIARVLYDKGYREFIEAARMVGNRHPNVDFELLGSLDEKNPAGVPHEMVERETKDGGIRYLGVSDNVPAVLGRDGVVSVLASFHEGLSRSLMEALAMGRPIITTDIPGCREMVEEGLNGYLVKPRNVEALADAMERFIALPLENKIAMGKASHRKAVEEYDIQFVIHCYDRILREFGFL